MHSIIQAVLRLLFAAPARGTFTWLSSDERNDIVELFNRYGLLFRRHQVLGTSSHNASRLEEAAHAVARRLCEATSAGDPDISFVIPVHNQLVLTLACLDSIARLTTTKRYEILIGDDASTPMVAAILSRIPCVRVITHSKRIGFLLNCNETARNARGRYLAILNNDVVLMPDWLDRITDTFVSHPDSGLVGGKLLFADGRLQDAGGLITEDGGATRIGRGQDPMLPEYNFVRDVDYCSAAAIVLPVNIWRTLSGFDPEFAPAYYEDTDFSFRIRELGLKVRYQPAAVAIHFEGSTHRSFFKKETKKIRDINRDKFRRRWQLSKSHSGVPLRSQTCVRPV